MHSLPLSSPSSAAYSPAGATLPAIRTEYAGSTSFISAGQSYRDHSGDIWTDPSCDDVGTWYLTSQRYGTRERFFADGRHWAAPGSTYDLVAVEEAASSTTVKPALVSCLRANPVPVRVVPTFELAADPATRDLGEDGGVWRKAVSPRPQDLGAEVHDDDFDLTPEELIAELKRDAILTYVSVGLCLLAGVAILALPFAAAFGWF